MDINLAIWLISATILVIGLVNLPKHVTKRAAVVLLAFKAFINFIDLFPNQQTNLRETAFLITAIGVNVYAVYQRRKHGL